MAVFLALTTFTWARWGSIQIDCGREMYVPAAIVNGRMLYRDLWYPYGPLAPYWNATLFQIFGARLSVLYGSGLAITFTFALTLFALSCKFLAPAPAFVITLSFLLQAFQPGLFNYVLPYAYSSSLGSLFALLCLFFLVRHISSGSGPNLLLAGSSAGLALLSKTEFGCAAYFTLATGVVFRAFIEHSWRSLGRSILYIMPGAALSAAVYGWWAWKLSPSFLLNENLWPAYFMREFAGPWLRANGLRFVPREVATNILVDALSLAAWAIVAVLAARVLALRKSAPLVLVLVAATVLAMLALGVVVPRRWIQYLVFPIGMYWIAVIPLIRTLWILRRDGRVQIPDVALSLVAVYSMSVGARTMGNILPYSYSSMYNHVTFLLFITQITAVSGIVTGSVASWTRSAALSCVLAGEVAGLAIVMAPRYRLMPSTRLITDRGIIYTDDQLVRPFSALIAFINTEKQAGRNVIVLPEIPALYFFCGIDPPSRWYVVTPGILQPGAAEQQFIREVGGVDHIVISNRRTSVYGVPYFGIDYNQAVFSWIEANYEPAGEIGHFVRAPTAPFAALIYRRRTTEHGPAASIGF